MKTTKLLLGLMLIVFLAKAQENPKKCGTTPLMEYEMKTNPQYKNIVDNYFNGLEEWLKNNYKNIETFVIPLDNIFKDFQIALSNFNSLHGFANSRARLRMATLYQIAQSNNGLVVGTGNKVEDFGVGFYTKYGDGGVDISPIGDCNKTEIWEMGGELGIIKQIIDAVPTDGLWDDARSDENQLGLSYEQIEAAMSNSNSKYYKKYLKIREPNLHKIKPIPVCKIKKNVKQ